MGIEIYSLDSTGAYPRPIVVELRCDTIGCQGFGQFDAYEKVSPSGWLERRTTGARQFICPTCSGKGIKMDAGPLPKTLDRRRVIWTYTMLKTYRDICPYQTDKRFVSKVIPFFKTPDMEWGDTVHVALEDRMGGKQLPEPMRHWEPIARQYDGYLVRAEPKLAVDENWQPCDYFDNNTAYGRGRADVLILDTESAYLGDWKTGTPRDDDYFELEVQAALVKAKYPFLKRIVGQYIWLKENQIGTLRDLSNTDATRAEISRLYKLILQDRQLGHFEKRKSGLCGWCPCEDCEHHYVSPKRGR